MSDKYVYTVELAEPNEFNRAWLEFVLGLEPDPRGDGLYKDGWEMADETPPLKSVRAVFEGQGQLVRPQYRIVARRLVRYGDGATTK